jgi:phosphotriesterase-related protein
MVAALVEKGYANRITLSHDSCCNFHWAPEGLLDTAAPTWRLTHIPLDVVPMLKERGVSEADIHQMTVLNPRAVFGG